MCCLHCFFPIPYLLIVMHGVLCLSVDLDLVEYCAFSTVMNFIYMFLFLATKVHEKIKIKVETIQGFSFNPMGLTDRSREWN